MPGELEQHLGDVAALAEPLRRPEGRRGPDAGRPAKLYRRAARDVAITVPERHYELAAFVLAEGIVEAGQTGAPLTEAVRDAARRCGRAMVTGDMSGDAAGGVGLAQVGEALRSHGYEPRLETEERMTLRNCPYNALAEDYRDLVCGINLALVEGLLDTLEAAGITARLEPEPARCCVTLRAARR